MPSQPKPEPRPVGRPKLASGAKSSTVLVRFSPEDRQRLENAAQASKQTVSEWTRNMLIDFKMTESEWTKVLSLFGKARDEYSHRGDKAKARKCDDAIALAQNIMLELSQ